MPSCSDCARAVRGAVASGETAPEPEQPQPTARERRRAERLLRSCCAWCLKNVRNLPVVGIYATLQDRRGASDPPSGAMTSIMIAGRLVPGFILDPDAGACADIAFMVCGETCADALRDAIATDRTFSVVH